MDELTGGCVAYVYLPDTYAGGYPNFKRCYFAQVGKDAAIIDERYNGGGDIADYIIDYLRRPLLSYWNMREGKDITAPLEAIFGPKVMIINEMAGSVGDALARDVPQDRDRSAGWVSARGADEWGITPILPIHWMAALPERPT